MAAGVAVGSCPSGGSGCSGCRGGSPLTVVSATRCRGLGWGRGRSGRPTRAGGRIGAAAFGGRLLSTTATAIQERHASHAERRLRT
eukprot:1159262-Pelagomonas_calceolata.AAC.4